MKLFLLIVLFVADVVVADPTQCNFCNTNYDWSGSVCVASQTNQTCTTDPYSLGTTHCGSVKYKSKPWSIGFFRGCFDCADKRTACLALSGFLKPETLLQCEIECCTGDNCNTQVPTLTQNSTTVYTSNANGPNQCQRCLNDDADNCTLNQDAQTCDRDSYSLGNTHCGSAVIKYRDLSGKIVNDSHVRGCINCADKKEACTILGGDLKRRYNGTNLLDCEIQCCNDSSNCNDRAADLAKCNYCMGRDAGSCYAPKSRQICDIDPGALGKPHCGTAVGKYRDQFGKVEDIFYRGCFDCTDKKAACFALGGYLKGDVENPGKITLLRCNIECCNSSNSYCNTQKPTLLPAKITVFTPTVTGPALCNVCLENNVTGCIKNQQTQVCATDPFSLGTTHCGSAVGKYRDILGNVVAGFYRGCINCLDKQAACAAVGGFRKNVQKWTQLECKIECCADDNCNTQTPSLFPGSTCPTGWVLHGKYCYLVIDVPTLEWNDARRNCQKLGGDLAKITSAAQNQFIFNLLLKQKKVMYYGAWLGLHRKADTKFYWADDTPLMGYTAWYAGQPNSPSNGKCGHIIAKGSAKGKWNDWHCSLAESRINVAPVVLCQKKI